MRRFTNRAEPESLPNGLCGVVAPLSSDSELALPRCAPVTRVAMGRTQPVSRSGCASVASSHLGASLSETWGFLPTHPSLGADRVWALDRGLAATGIADGIDDKAVDGVARAPSLETAMLQQRHP